MRIASQLAIYRVSCDWGDGGHDFVSGGLRLGWVLRVYTKVYRLYTVRLRGCGKVDVIVRERVSGK